MVSIFDSYGSRPQTPISNAPHSTPEGSVKWKGPSEGETRDRYWDEVEIST